MPDRILVVDDEVDLEMLIRHKFRKRIAEGELEFFFGHDGEEALAILESEPEIQLLITDINMPVMDGLTLLSRAAELPRLIKTVIVSAYDDLDNIRIAMNRGAYDFLTKPIDFTDLETTVDKTLRELKSLQEGLLARQQLSALEFELGIASRIQRSILPDIITGYERFKITATMLPARQVSGDFYDFFFVDKDRLGLVIGDVSGKGIPAALFMAVSRTLLRATALHGGTPRECLDHVNRVLLKQSDGEVFLTLFYGILDLESGRFEFSAGAQPPPCFFSRNGTGKFLREPRGMMLGLLEEATYESAAIDLKPGDGLVLYTDGVTEAESAAAEFFTEKRLQQAIESNKHCTVEQLAFAITDDIKTFTAGRDQADDITLLVVKFRAADRP
jgi:sigma-B regulation protein RsbU (phosphoserine phosphatase)